MAFPDVLLKKIDKLAKAEYTTRSDFIRQTLLQTAQQREQQEADQLKQLGADLAADVRAAGYRTDADFDRLAKEVRGYKKAQS